MHEGLENSRPCLEKACQQKTRNRAVSPSSPPFLDQLVNSGKLEFRPFWLLPKGAKNNNKEPNHTRVLSSLWMFTRSLYSLHAYIPSLTLSDTHSLSLSFAALSRCGVPHSHISFLCPIVNCFPHMVAQFQTFSFLSSWNAWCVHHDQRCPKHLRTVAPVFSFEASAQWALPSLRSTTSSAPLTTRPLFHISTRSAPCSPVAFSRLWPLVGIAHSCRCVCLSVSAPLRSAWH